MNPVYSALYPGEYTGDELINSTFSYPTGKHPFEQSTNQWSVIAPIAGFQSIPWDSEDKDTAAILVGTQ